MMYSVSQASRTIGWKDISWPLQIHAYFSFFIVKSWEDQEYNQVCTSEHYKMSEGFWDQLVPPRFDKESSMKCPSEIIMLGVFIEKKERATLKLLLIKVTMHGLLFWYLERPAACLVPLHAWWCSRTQDATNDNMTEAQEWNDCVARQLGGYYIDWNVRSNGISWEQEPKTWAPSRNVFLSQKPFK